jgi:uncharacterized protein YjbJ (UPF0337 family)
MRYRVAFFAGLAAGFVIGARAGRERYEQLKKLARRAADSPAVQQAAGAAQAQAAGLARSARDKVTGKIQERLPKLAETAKDKVGGKLPDRAAARSRDGNGHADGGAFSRKPGAPQG